MDGGRVAGQIDSPVSGWVGEWVDFRKARQVECQDSLKSLHEKDSEFCLDRMAWLRISLQLSVGLF